MTTRFGIITDYEYTAAHKRHRIVVWSGSFNDVFEAEGYSLPKGDGYMLTTYNGDKLRVTCPTGRTDDNYCEVDAAISEALNAHYDAIGATSLVTVDEARTLQQSGI